MLLLLLDLTACHQSCGPPGSCIISPAHTSVATGLGERLQANRTGAAQAGWQPLGGGGGWRRCCCLMKAQHEVPLSRRLLCRFSLACSMSVRCRQARVACRASNTVGWAGHWVIGHRTFSRGAAAGSIRGVLSLGTTLVDAVRIKAADGSTCSLITSMMQITPK